MSPLPSVTQQSPEGLLHARLWGECGRRSAALGAHFVV